MSEFKVKVGQKYTHESENGYYEVLFIHKDKAFVAHIDRFGHEMRPQIFDTQWNAIFREEYLYKEEQGE